MEKDCIQRRVVKPSGKTFSTWIERPWDLHEYSILFGEDPETAQIVLTISHDGISPQIFLHKGEWTISGDI